MLTLSKAVEGAAVSIIVVAVAAVTVIVTVSPWFVGFGGAVAAAATWCAWLDRHPE